MSLKVRDVMSPAPIAVPTTATLVEAAQRMRVADVGDVLVLDDDRACGESAPGDARVPRA